MSLLIETSNKIYLGSIHVTAELNYDVQFKSIYYCVLHFTLGRWVGLFLMQTSKVPLTLNDTTPCQ